MDAGELELHLDEVRAAEARFLATVAGLDEEGLAEPTLCHGWSRGHVIAHVALNAHSIVNLMTWARTGDETPQYASAERREADIERFASRTPAEHLTALEEATGAYLEAARSVPLDRWGFQVRGITGIAQPVSNYLDARMGEVEIHHVDLVCGYDSGDWPEGFVGRMLRRVPARLGAEVAHPFTIEAPDLGLSFDVGDGGPSVRVSGPGHVLLKWCLGRSGGAGLRTESGALPAIPAWG